jgi:hypothetical protein
MRLATEEEGEGIPARVRNRAEVVKYVSGIFFILWFLESGDLRTERGLEKSDSWAVMGHILDVGDGTLKTYQRTPKRPRKAATLTQTEPRGRNSNPQRRQHSFRRSNHWCRRRPFRCGERSCRIR